MAIVCHCNAVRERTIQKAIRRGAMTVEEVQAECGAAARCGGCEPIDSVDARLRAALRIDRRRRPLTADGTSSSERRPRRPCR